MTEALGEPWRKTRAEDGDAFCSSGSVRTALAWRIASPASSCLGDGAAPCVFLASPNQWGFLRILCNYAKKNTDFEGHGTNALYSLRGVTTARKAATVRLGGEVALRGALLARGYDHEMTRPKHSFKKSTAIDATGSTGTHLPLARHQSAPSEESRSMNRRTHSFKRGHVL
jgi:hypothetical protein